jgi:polysaccharide biosynthesis transport protein
MTPELAQAPLTGETPGGAFSISEYLGVFKRRVWTIIIPALLCILIGALVANLITPRYESVMRIKVTDPGIGRDLASLRVTAPPHKAMLASVKSDIQNRTFLEPVIKSTGLTEGMNVTDPKQLSQLIEYVKKNLTVKWNNSEKGSDQIEIFYVGRDPRKVAEFIDAVRVRFVDNFLKEYRGTVRGIYDNLAEQQKDIEAQLAKKIAQHEAFANDPDYKLMGADANMQKRLGDLEALRSSLGVDITGLETQLKLLGDQMLGVKPETTARNMVPNPKREQKLLEKKQIEAALTDMTVNRGFTSKVQSVKDAMDAVAKIDEELKTLPELVEGTTTLQQNQVHVNFETERAKLNRELAGKRKTSRDVTTEADGLREKLARIAALRVDERRFSEEIDELRRRQKDINTKFDNAETSWVNISGRGSEIFNIQDFPRSDGDPVFPNKILFMLIGLGAGFLFGLGLAFVKEFATLTYTSSDQVQSALPIRVLGSVSHITTIAEVEERRSRRLRWTAVIVGVLVLFAALYGTWSNPKLARRLPQPVVKVFDKVFGKPGR